MRKFLAATLCAAVLGTGIMATSAQAQEAPEVTESREVAETIRNPFPLSVERAMQYELPPIYSLDFERQYRSPFTQAFEAELLDEMGKLDEDAFFLSMYRFEMYSHLQNHHFDAYDSNTFFDRIGRDAAKLVIESAGGEAALAMMPVVNIFASKAEKMKDELREKHATLRHDKWSFSPDLDFGDGFMVETSYEFAKGYKVRNTTSLYETELSAPVRAPEQFVSKMEKKFGKHKLLKVIPELLQWPAYVKTKYHFDRGPQILIGYRALFNIW